MLVELRSDFLFEMFLSDSFFDELPDRLTWLPNWDEEVINAFKPIKVSEDLLFF